MEKNGLTRFRRTAPVALLALVALAQVSAFAGTPIGGGPPAPTLRLINDDQYINADEASSIMVRATYNTLWVPPITSAHVKIVGTIKDGPLAPCASGAPYSTPLLVSTVPDPGGFFMVGPFDVSAFPDNVVLCAVGFVRAGAQQSGVATSNLAIKDTIGPAAGSVVMIETVLVDGVLNQQEANAQCCVQANWSHPDPGDVTSTQVWFEDSTNTMTGGCGIFNVGPSGFGAVNSTCANSMAQGPFVFLGRWFDQAGNASPLASASLIKDTLGPDLEIISPETGVEVAPGTSITVTGTGDPGTPLRFILDGNQIGTGTVAPDGTWTFTFTSPTPNGSYTLVVEGTDAYGNVTAPSIVIEVNDLLPVIILPVEGGVEDGTTTVYGRGRPASQIELYEGTLLVGRTRVGSDGFWTIVTGLPDGVHVVRARGFDGVPSSLSAPRTFTVDAGLPTVTITTTALGPFPVDIALLPDGITGTATDGLEGVSRIRLEYFNVLGTRVLAEDAICSGCGPAGTSVTWEHTPSLGLPGIYTVVAQAFDVRGNASVRRTLKILVAG